MNLQNGETKNQSKKFIPLNRKISFSSDAIREYHAIHHEAVLISKDLMNHEFRLIEILQKIDEKKVYMFMGMPSLSKYARIALKLSEDRAYLYVGIARKAKNLSRMQEALRDGSLKISNAKRISPVITPENQEHWVKLGKNLSQRSLDRAIAQVNPKSSVQEGARFVSENTLEFKAAIDLETEEIFKRAQDVLSQSLGRAATYQETIREMGKAYLNQKDPVVKAQRILKKRIKSEAKAKRREEATVDTRNHSSRGEYRREAIPAELKHEVNARDLGKCRDVSGGTPCGEERWVDSHHIIPVSKGGKNVLENLITLCRGHHRLEHFRVENEH